jgi:hypothetical protein
LQLADERVSFVTGEFARSLTLGKTHRATCVTEVSVTGVLEEG